MKMKTILNLFGLSHFKSKDEKVGLNKILSNLKLTCSLLNKYNSNDNYNLFLKEVISKYDIENLTTKDIDSFSFWESIYQDYLSTMGNKILKAMPIGLYIFYFENNKLDDIGVLFSSDGFDDVEEQFQIYFLNMEYETGLHIGHKEMSHLSFKLFEYEKYDDYESGDE